MSFGRSIDLLHPLELKGASIDSNLQNQQILPVQRSLTKDFIVVYQCIQLDFVLEVWEERRSRNRTRIIHTAPLSRDPLCEKRTIQALSRLCPGSVQCRRNRGPPVIALAQHDLEA